MQFGSYASIKGAYTSFSISVILKIVTSFEGVLIYLGFFWNFWSQLEVYYS